jgi:exopolyphosphatase / guanosine-5'-triphosphate,3'-diphosphate pyrophosphatase
MYACIDLGSNSFHLLIAEKKKKKGIIQLIERCSDKVQIGEGVQKTGKISSDAFERGLQSLRHFQNIISRHPVERYWALGTNTFRAASNTDKFICAAREIGIEISVISGVQEAMLIYAGVISGLPTMSGKRLVIDIGGGSTELIVGKRHKRLFTHSLPVGCVGWRDRFFDKSERNSEKLHKILEQATDAARDIFLEVAPGVSKYEWIHTYASSGTAKMLAAVSQEQGYGKGEICLSGLEKLQDLMIETIVKGEPLPGLTEKRRDLLLPGCAVMKGLMQAFKVKLIQFSPSAMREGMLDFMLKRSRKVRGLKRRKLPQLSHPE